MVKGPTETRRPFVLPQGDSPEAVVVREVVCMLFSLIREFLMLTVMCSLHSASLAHLDLKTLAKSISICLR